VQTHTHIAVCAFAAQRSGNQSQIKCAGAKDNAKTTRARVTDDAGRAVQCSVQCRAYLYGCIESPTKNECNDKQTDKQQTNNRQTDRQKQQIRSAQCRVSERQHSTAEAVWCGVAQWQGRGHEMEWIKYREEVMCYVRVKYIHHYKLLHITSNPAVTQHIVFTRSHQIQIINHMQITSHQNSTHTPHHYKHTRANAYHFRTVLSSTFAVGVKRESDLKAQAMQGPLPMQWSARQTQQWRRQRR